MSLTKVSVFWFRRDLRLVDNLGLKKALSSGFPVLPIFIFDKSILDKLDDKMDRRVDYIHQVLNKMNQDLVAFDTKINTFYGHPLDVFKALTALYSIQGVYCNRDYEPEAISRDTEIYEYLKKSEVVFKAFKDQVIFDKNDVLKPDNTPYTVYTPYAKKWNQFLQEKNLTAYACNLDNLIKQPITPIHSLSDISFTKTDIIFNPPVLNASIINEYHKNRDYPALQGTTELGIALRFGTISIRKCVKYALEHNQTWLNELIWREFFMQILYHFPQVTSHAFKAKYEKIKWRNNESEFEKWCNGQTGYPIVDAGMQQLNNTGFMHNRVRMITASFLCKHLLIDWRWGEAYFAQKLNDYDLAANIGNWQWAAGSGCDAAPYFRIFNPTIQTKKFDKDLVYIKRWLPFYGTKDYPKQIVEHNFARERALRIYSEAVK